MIDSDRTAAELLGRLGFARGLGRGERVQEIYEAVGREAATADIGDEDRWVPMIGWEGYERPTSRCVA